MQVAAPQLLQLMNIRVQGGGRYIQLHSYRAIKLPCTALAHLKRTCRGSLLRASSATLWRSCRGRPPGLAPPRPAPPAASPADLRQEGLWPVAVPHRPKCTSAQWARGGHWGPGHCTIDMKQWVGVGEQHLIMWQKVLLYQSSCHLSGTHHENGH